VFSFGGHRIQWVAGSAWAAALLAGFGLLQKHQTTPGAAAAVIESAEVAEELRAGFETGKGVLVMFLHPLCPCSRASVEELGRLIALCPASNARVLMARPEGLAEEQVHGELWRAVEQIKGVKVEMDAHGVAERLGVWTSGQVMVWDAAGRLRFSGGITGSRGHEGDNAGLTAAIRAVRGESDGAETLDQPARTAVFGCELMGRAPALVPGTQPVDLK
jgi:hypothetical protein